MHVHANMRLVTCSPPPHPPTRTPPPPPHTRQHTHHHTPPHTTTHHHHTRRAPHTTHHTSHTTRHTHHHQHATTTAAATATPHTHGIIFSEFSQTKVSSRTIANRVEAGDSRNACRNGNTAVAPTRAWIVVWLATVCLFIHELAQTKLGLFPFQQGVPDRVVPPCPPPCREYVEIGGCGGLAQMPVLGLP